MAFGIGTNPPQADAGNVRGTQRRIACECWFTSTGRIMPLMLKIQDEPDPYHPGDYGAFPGEKAVCGCALHRV